MSKSGTTLLKFLVNAMSATAVLAMASFSLELDWAFGISVILWAHSAVLFIGVSILEIKS